MFLKFLILIIALPLGAADTATLELSHVLAETVKNNPEIQAARAELEQSDAMARSARAWEAPMLSLEWMPMERRRFELTQNLPFPGRTWQAGSVAQHDARRKEAMLRMAIENRVLEARQAYWELAAAERALKGAERTLEALKGMRSLSSKRAGFGQLDRMGQLMDTMLAMDSAEMETMFPHWRQERLKAEARLNRLMGQDPSQSLPAAALSIESLGMPDSSQRLLDRNPELDEARHHVEHAKAARRLSQSGWLPDLSLQGALEEDNMGNRESSLMLGISLPWLWFWGRAGEVSAATAELSHSEKVLSSTQQKLNEQIVVQQQDLKNSTEELAIVAGKMLPLSEQGLKQAVSGFASGTVGANEALMAIRAYWMTEERLSHLISHIGMARAMLEMLSATYSGAHTLEMSHE